MFPKIRVANSDHSKRNINTTFAVGTACDTIIKCFLSILYSNSPLQGECSRWCSVGLK